MGSVLALITEALYMFEGMAQGGLGANWGDGHATDAGLLTRVPTNANPNPFYQQLVNAPYANNAIISTHVYGCSLLSLGATDRYLAWRHNILDTPAS